MLLISANELLNVAQQSEAFTALDWTLIIGVIGSQILLVTTGILTLIFQFISRHETKAAAVKVEVAAKEVAETLAVDNTKREAVLETIAKVGEDTHTLVNSNMGVQLSMNAALSRWKADREPAPENIAAADYAEQKLLEHQAKQAVVDKKGI